jgi:hypothetical protein
MAVRLSGADTVILPVEIQRGSRETPVLIIAARRLRNPRQAEIYVQVFLQRREGRDEDLGNFTFFGVPPGEDEQLFAFPLEPGQHEALILRTGQIRAVLKSMDTMADVSDVGVELHARVEEPSPRT